MIIPFIPIGEKSCGEIPATEKNITFGLSITFNCP